MRKHFQRYHELGQYTLWQILGMWLLGWVAYPAMSVASRRSTPKPAEPLSLRRHAQGLAWFCTLAILIPSIRTMKPPVNVN